MLTSQRVEGVTLHVEDEKTLALETYCVAINVNYLFNVGANLADLTNV